MKINDIIKQPESRRLEFKQELPTVADLAKTIARTKLGLSWDQVSTKLVPGWNQVINLLENAESPIGIKEMMNILEWKSRTKFRKKYINPLLEEELMKMTIPDNPQSSKQQYFLSEKGIAFYRLLKNKIDQNLG